MTKIKTEARSFYGDAYTACPNPEMLDDACRKMDMAMNAANPNIGERAMTLAANVEAAAWIRSGASIAA